MTKGLALLVLTAGCYMSRPTNEVVDGPSHVDDAVATFNAWAAENMAAEHPVQPDAIYWVRGDCLDVPDTPGCWQGMAYNSWSTDCEIWLTDKFSIAASSFTHEMLHCLGYREFDGADEDHDTLPWDRVVEVNVAIWAWECAIRWPDNDRC